jgi:hypothetical protein
MEATLPRFMSKAALVIDRGGFVRAEAFLA